MSMGEEDLENKIEPFFEEHGFDSPAKKASFAVGMLTDYLLMVQRKERNIEFGEEPFWKILRGLRLDERKVREIFYRVIAKLKEYRKGTFIEKIAGKYLAEAEGKWDISKDEISYYFTMGLTLRSTLMLIE